jgi:hypothetical protein
MNIFKLILKTVPFLLIYSCAFRPIESNLIAFKNDSIYKSLGSGKVLVYNGASWKHKIDNTSTLDVWLNKQTLGQIMPKEYLILNIPLGKQTINLFHFDLFRFESQHDIIINDSTKIISLSPTVFSNSVKITNKLPKKFQEYKRIN